METLVEPGAVRRVLDELVALRSHRDRERKRVVAGKVIGRPFDWLAPFEPQIREAFASAGRAGYAGSWEATGYLDDETLDAIVEVGYDSAWDYARWEDHEAYDQDCGHIDGLTEAIDRLSVLLDQESEDGAASEG